MLGDSSDDLCLFFCIDPSSIVSFPPLKVHFQENLYLSFFAQITKAPMIFGLITSKKLTNLPNRMWNRYAKLHFLFCDEISPPHSIPCESALSVHDFPELFINFVHFLAWHWTHLYVREKYDIKNMCQCC